MNCPNCNAQLQVIDSRTINNKVRRRRNCINCNKRFTTYESFDYKIKNEKLRMQISHLRLKEQFGLVSAWMKQRRKELRNKEKK